MKGYCMKCRAMREMKNVKYLTKKGRRFAKGTCAKCGTVMYKIMPKR